MTPSDAAIEDHHSPRPVCQGLPIWPTAHNGRLPAIIHPIDVVLVGDFLHLAARELATRDPDFSSPSLCG